MATDSGGDTWLKLGLLFLLGLVSLPFVGPRVGMDETGPKTQPVPCKEGIGFEPYCSAADTGKGFRSGSSLMAEFYGRRDTILDTTLCDSVQVMVATLPDPIESHLPNSFDTYLYAVSQAHERAGYVMDRYWLPWHAGEQPGDPLSSGAHGARSTPGALLFRRMSAGLQRPRLSLVYLVGETPTQGINKDAFRLAVANLLRVRHGCRDTELPLLAPFFSGSAPSLVQVLQGFGQSVPRARIVSGSATAPANAQLRKSALSFQATVHNTDALERAFVAVRDSLGIPKERVARLTERATAYGQSFSDQGLTIPFPMNIATIRSALEGVSPKLPGGNDKSQGRSEAEPKVPLGPSSTAGLRDIVPTFSQATVATQEILLNQIARVLAERRILLVGLLATDVRDKLFLARELHRRLPHLLFYTFESNALYLRSDYEEAALGMMVLSSYPLIPQVGEKKDLLQLVPTDASYGVYNATLVLLGLDSLVSYPYADSVVASPARRTLPVWITVVGSGSLEPVNVLHSNDTTGYVYAASGSATPPRPSVPRKNMLLAFAIAGALLVRSPVRRFLRGVRRRYIAAEWARRNLRRGLQAPELSPGQAFWGAFRAPPDRTPGDSHRRTQREKESWYDAESRVFGETARLSVACAMMPVAFVLTAGVSLHQSVNWIVAAAPVAICFASLVVDVAVLPRQKGKQVFQDAVAKGRPEKALRVLFYLVLLFVVYCSVMLTWEIASLGKLNPSEPALFWTRARALGSRASPLLPIILVGVSSTFWCLWHWKRSRLLTHMTTFERANDPHEWGTPSQFPEAWKQIRASTVEFRHRLSLLTPTKRALWVLVVALVTAYILARGVFNSLEALISPALDWYFHWLLWVGIIGGLTLTMLSVDRLLQLWSTLKQFLSWLERLPLRVAFDRLPPQVNRLTQLTQVSPFRWEVWRDWQDQRWMQLSNLGHLEPGAPTILLPAELPAPVEADARVGEAGVSGLRQRREEVRLAAVLERLERDWSVEPDDSVIEDVADALKQLKDVRADPATSAISSKLRHSASVRERLWMRAAEEYVAADVVDYVDWAVSALRAIALFLAGAILCVTLLLFSYPIPQERFVRLLFLAVFFATVGALARIIVDMNRNQMMSRITGTAPGKLSLDRPFITNMAVLVGLPLVGYGSAVLPELRGVLFGWLTPLLGVLAR